MNINLQNRPTFVSINTFLNSNRIENPDQTGSRSIRERIFEIVANRLNDQDDMEVDSEEESEQNREMENIDQRFIALEQRITEVAQDIRQNVERVAILERAFQAALAQQQPPPNNPNPNNTDTD